MRQLPFASRRRLWNRALRTAIPIVALLGLAACGGGGGAAGEQAPAVQLGNGGGDPPFGASAGTASFFTDQRNGTVAQGTTGLVWLKDANCDLWSATWSAWYTDPGKMPWQNAMDAVKLLAHRQCGLNDYSKAGDWRLATRDELLALANADPKGSALFSNIQDWYWTSEDADGDGYWGSRGQSFTAYVVSFSWWNAWSWAHKASDYNFVWPVRSVRCGDVGQPKCPEPPIVAGQRTAAQ